MSVLKKQIQRLIEAQKRDQKEVAMAIAEVAIEGKKPSPATVEKNFAMLGKEEGNRFFFDFPPRLARLAQEVGCTEEELRTWRAAPTLILAFVTEEFAEFVRRPETSDDGTRYDVVEGVSGRPQLRDAAIDEAASLLVMEDPRAHAEFFGGAGIADRLVSFQKVPRGWRIVERPDLLKIPPPRQATTFFTAEGAPLFHHPNPAKRLDANEEEVLVSLSTINETFKTNLFWEQGALWSWKEVLVDHEKLAPHQRPRILEPRFLEIMKGREPQNPFRFADAFDLTLDSLKDIVAKAGLAFAPEMEGWLGNRLSSLVERRKFEWQLNALPKFEAQWPRTACTPEEENVPRALLAGLATRQWAQYEDSDLPLTSIIQVLQAVCDAHWVTFAATSSAQWQFTANLGAGRLVLGAIWSFSQQSPAPVMIRSAAVVYVSGSGYRPKGPGILDAGDVVAKFEATYNELLEGAAQPARKRRNEDD